MQERKCNSCHNVTFLVWSHNEAAARGFDVDRTKLAEWTKWSLADSLSDRFWFMLRPRAMASLKADGFPEALLAKLKPLGGEDLLTRHGISARAGGGHRRRKPRREQRPPPQGGHSSEQRRRAGHSQPTPAGAGRVE